MITGLIDFMKVFFKNPNGFNCSNKFIIQTVFTCLIFLFFENKSIFIPYFNYSIYLGKIFINFLYFSFFEVFIMLFNRRI